MPLSTQGSAKERGGHLQKEDAKRAKSKMKFIKSGKNSRSSSGGFQKTNRHEREIMVEKSVRDTQIRRSEKTTPKGKPVTDRA